MAKDIKQRATVKEVKSLDRAKLISDKLRQAKTRAKEELSEVSGSTGEQSPDGYADEKIRDAVSDAIHTAARLNPSYMQTKKSEGILSGNRKFENIPENSRRFISGQINAKDKLRIQRETTAIRKNQSITVAFHSRKQQDTQTTQPASSLHNSESITKQKTAPSKKIDRNIKQGKTYKDVSGIKLSGTKAAQEHMQGKAVKDQAKRMATNKLKQKSAARTAKSAKNISIKTVKAIIAAARSLITLIASSSVAVMVVLLIVLVFAIIAASPFGIGLSGEETPGIVAEIEKEYSDVVDKTIKENAHDELEVTGKKAPWSDILAIYAVRMNLSANNTLAADESQNNNMTVATYTDKQKKELRKIFWDMNIITHKTVTENVSVTTITPSGLDEGDWEVGETTTVAIKVLKINTAAKSCGDMAKAYSFTDEQNTFLAEFLTDDGREMLNSALYGVGSSSGSDDIVEIAKQYIGNKGGEIFWRYMGFNSRVAWCACFVSYCANEAGYIESGVLPKYASCEKGGRASYIPWLKQRGLWHDAKGYAPNVGDLIFFDWGGDGLADHIGIVEYVKGSAVHTIEGNTSDMVARRSYSLNNVSIKGYGAPNY